MKYAGVRAAVLTAWMLIDHCYTSEHAHAIMLSDLISEHVNRHMANTHASHTCKWSVMFN